MGDNERPKVLLINCCMSKEPDVVQGILGANCAQSGVSKNETWKEYAMKIDNKYYTAEVSLMSTDYQNHDKVVQEVLNDVSALIIPFEMKNESIFDNIKALGDKFDDSDVDIKLLLSTETERSSELDEKRKMILEWCIKNSFELVECYQTDDNEEFPEKFGFERIKEALHTHMWSNMVQKSRPGNDLMTEKAENSKQNDATLNGNEESKTMTHPVQSPTNNTNELDPLVAGTELEGESFEEMFSRLQEMKMHASSLPHEQRKDYAEKIAIAFWKAMGQDDDEISGL